MDSKHPEIIQLQLEFLKIDTNGDGFINETELKNYLGQKHIPYQLWDLKDAFNISKNKLSQNRFVTFMLANQVMMIPFAFMQFSLENHIQNYMDANPPQLHTCIKKSNITLLLGDQGFQDKNNRSIGVKIGVSKTSLNENTVLLKEIIGGTPETIYFLFELKLKSKGQQICQLLNQILNSVKQLLSELDQNVAKLLKDVQILCKYHQDRLFIVIQFTHPLFERLAKTFDDFVMMANPNCQLLCHGELQSTMFDTILTKGLNAEVKQIALNLGLQIDEVTLSKLRKILNQENSNPYSNGTDNSLMLFMMSLLQEISFDAKFSKISELLQSLGLTDNSLDLKEKLSFLKEMNISQLLASFFPDSIKAIELIRQNSEGIGQVSLHIKEIYIKVDFSLNVEGVFDLIL